MITQTGSVVVPIVPDGDDPTTSQTAIKGLESCCAKTGKFWSRHCGAINIFLVPAIISGGFIGVGLSPPPLYSTTQKAMFYGGLALFGLSTLISGSIIGRKIHKIENYQGGCEFIKNNKVFTVSTAVGIVVVGALAFTDLGLVLTGSNFLAPLMDAGLATFGACSLVGLASNCHNGWLLLEKEENEIPIPSQKKSIQKEPIQEESIQMELTLLQPTQGKLDAIIRDTFGPGY